MEREKMQKRTLNVDSRFHTRDEEDSLKIEGYFSVFNSIYELWDGATEEIERGAFTETLDGDIRALIDHDTRLVLGRTTAGTLTLREDEHGLFGSIEINPKDSDAMNLYERVKRGDVSQCSFGFEILKEETETSDDGNSIHWRIQKVLLHEVSVCTFPAYKETEVSARKEQADDIKKRRLEAWKSEKLKKLRGEE